jgi:hypothetical protein
VGALLAPNADGGNSRWEIIASNLPAGRHILRVSGSTNGNRMSAYSGQLAFVPEPGTLALLRLGLLGLGVAPRQRN